MLICLNKMFDNQCFVMRGILDRELDGNSDRFVRRAIDNILERIEWCISRKGNSVVRGSVMKYEQWCGWGSKILFGCHVSTKST